MSYGISSTMDPVYFAFFPACALATTHDQPDMKARPNNVSEMWRRTLMMSAMGGCIGLTGRGAASRVATLCTSRLGQCSSLLVIAYRCQTMLLSGLDESSTGAQNVQLYRSSRDMSGRCRHGVSIAASTQRIRLRQERQKGSAFKE